MSYVDILLSLIVAFIMFSVGLSLRPDNFIRTFSQPKPYVSGVVLQLIFLPLFAFSVTTFWGLPAAFSVGIIILSACPGGTTSNFISYLLSGNTALSIALTVTNSLMALVSVPLIVNFGLRWHLGTETDLSLPVGPTVVQIFLITVVPTALGMWINRIRPIFALNVQETLRYVTLVLLALLFVIKLFASEESGGSGITLGEFAQILPVSVLVNLGSLASGYLLGKALNLGVDNELTLGVEVGIQNTSLAFLIAATLIGDEDMLKPALVYALFTFFTAVLYGLWLKPDQWRLLRYKFFRWWRRLGQTRGSI